MTIRQFLYRYRNYIKDWDSDKDPITGDGGYFIYLKKPYAIKDGLSYTDMISKDTLEEAARAMKWVEKIDPITWDNIN